MIDLVVVLPITLAALVALAVIAFAFRGSRAISETRSAQRFVREAVALGRELDALLADLEDRADRVRRRELPPAEAAVAARGVLGPLRSGADSARALAGPGDLAATRQVLVADLEAAVQAVEAVMSSCERAAEPRAVGAADASVAAGPEALADAERRSEQAVKRAYLGLVHARERLSERVAEIAARPAPARAWPVPSAARPAPAPSAPVAGAESPVRGSGEGRRRGP